MKNTNCKEFKEAVNSYILDCINSEDVELNTPTEKIEHLVKRFNQEAGHEIKRQGSIQDALAYWLSGLAIDLDYTYYNILELAKKWHEVDGFTEKKADMICERWWSFMACKIMQLAGKLNVRFV